MQLNGATTVVHNRPAETGGVVGAVTLLVVHLLGVTDPDVIVSLGIIVGFVPAAVTWTSKLWYGRHGPPSRRAGD